MNPKYGVLGLVSYPYWSIFEKAGPIIEMAGFLYTFYMIFTGDINALYFIGLFGLMYVFSVMISSFSILYEGVAYNNYKDKTDLNKLMKTVLLEPFLIHPKIILWGLRGHWHFIKGKGGWGEMIRTGFKKAEDKKKIKSPIQLQ
jgi:hypothetical protein